MNLNLPYPPSINHYWRTFRGRMILSASGREYRTEVMANILQNGKPNTIEGRVRVQIQVSPPDRRRRDIDNCVKCILDALAHAGVYHDDCQIDELHVKRGEIVQDGEAMVIVEELLP